MSLRPNPLSLGLGRWFFDLGLGARIAISMRDLIPYIRAKTLGLIHEWLRPYAPDTRWFPLWCMLGDMAYSRQLGTDLKYWRGYAIGLLKGDNRKS